VISAGSGNELRIDVDPDNLVPARMQNGTDPTGATTRIQNARTARHHGVDQAGFATEVGTFGGHPADAFYVQLRVVGISFGEPARRPCG
jgi:hypothetical protein